MENLTINKKNALKAFKDATSEGKKLLTNLFGEKALSVNIEERHLSVEDCYTELGLVRDEEIPFKNPITKRQRSLNAICDLDVITEVHREGWDPNKNYGNEYRYEPRFIKNSSGSGFSHSTYAYWYTCTSVGSRLCLQTPERAIYVGNEYIETYNQWLTNK